MSDNPPEEEKLSEEIRSLGQNLLGLFQVAWDHPERKRVQNEIEKGLHDLGTTLQKEADDFSNSPTGERLKNEIDDIGTRISTSETRAKIYEDLISALKVANNELSSAINRIGNKAATSTANETEEKQES